MDAEGRPNQRMLCELPNHLRDPFALSYGRLDDGAMTLA